MTLSTLFARLRASLSFRGFRAGGVVPRTEAQETLEDLRRWSLEAQMARASRIIPPEHLRRAEAKASAKLDRIRKEIRCWELEQQLKRAKMGVYD